MVGTLIGVLPGIGPVATIAMLLPITFHLPPTASLIMLAGIYYGAQYGGSTTSILVNLPGEASSVVTCLDGYQMARKGRAGAALSISAVGSFFAGTVGTIIIVIFAEPLTRMAQKFGPADYCSLMALGLVAAVVLASGSVTKAIAMVFLGLLFGLVGTDVNTGAQRFTFDIPELSDGIDFAPIAMGLFGIAEIVVNLEKHLDARRGHQGQLALADRARKSGARFRPSCAAPLLGSALGVLPGGGPTLGAFSAYTLEKKLSKNPGEFGKGAVEGVAAPEAANNAAAQTSFIPMLTLGIPSNAVMALMVGAMIIQGIQPGPEVMTKKPDLFWGMIASMWIGNADAGHHQPADDRHVGEAADGAVPLPRPGHPAVLLHRRLQPAEQYVPRHAGRGVRRAGLRLRPPRLRRRAVPAGPRAGSADGGILPARHAALARRRHGLPRAADQPRPAHHDDPAADPDGPAELSRRPARKPSRKRRADAP